jgi:polar amino acid transport system permease protein
MRSGMQSVDPGQLEAGRALGLSYWKAMLRIVIPKSIKNILPTLGNEFIVLIKETSIVGYIAIVDVTKAFKSIADNTYEYIIPYVILALVYLVLVILITWLIRTLERRFKKSDRQQA